MSGIKNLSKNSYFATAKDINNRIAVVNKLIADIENTSNTLDSISLITGASVSIFPITNIVEGRLGLDTSTNVLYTFVGGSWQTVIYP
jgi:hypothetical protein